MANICTFCKANNQGGINTDWQSVRSIQNALYHKCLVDMYYYQEDQAVYLATSSLETHSDILNSHLQKLFFIRLFSGNVKQSDFPFR